MRKVIMKFEDEKAKNNGVSSYVNFVRAIKGEKLSRSKMFSLFNMLVEKDDYLQSEKEKLVNGLLKNGLTT